LRCWACIAVSAVTALALAASAQGQGIAIGARIPGAPEHPGLIDSYARAVGRAPAIVSYYREWNQAIFDAASLHAISRRHAVPMITWEPTVNGWQRGDTATILRTIATGGADRYLRATARAAGRWPALTFLRFAPEMNGSWSPWGVRTPGNSAAVYVAAWRHVVSIFRSAGVHRVKWVWCPNVDDNGVLPFTRLYPGDRWVDWVGMDGYNWGGSYGWQSFTAIFASSYDTLARLTTKPMMIAETGSGENGGSKAAWITQTFSHELPKFSRLAALVWFNGGGDTGADFRFNSTAAAAKAFRAALSSPRYAAGADSLPGLAVRRRPFRSIVSPPAPKHGIARAVDLARRNWWVLAAAGTLVALAALAVLRRRSLTPRPHS